MHINLRRCQHALAGGGTLEIAIAVTWRKFEKGRGPHIANLSLTIGVPSPQRTATEEQACRMRAHQIMTRSVISVTPEATILEAASIMLRRHVSGLPVVDTAGKLVGIVSEGDFLRRSEIGTQRKAAGGSNS